MNSWVSCIRSVSLLFLSYYQIGIFLEIRFFWTKNDCFEVSWVILESEWPWGGAIVHPREVVLLSALIFLHLPNSWRLLQPFWSIWTSKRILWLWHDDALCVTYRFPPSYRSKRDGEKSCFKGSFWEMMCALLQVPCYNFVQLVDFSYTSVSAVQAWSVRTRKQ